jgi:LPS-assembly protein
MMTAWTKSQTIRRKRQNKSCPLASGKRAKAFLILMGSLALWVQGAWGLERNPADRFLKNEAGSWEIKAKTLSYDQKEGLYVAEGDVVVSRGNQVLKADRAKYNEKTGMIEVKGNVVLESNGDILRAKEAVFDLQSQAGRITGGHIFLKENHYWISGETMEKTGPNTYVVKECRVTTCDGETPDWSITGSEVKITVEGYGSVKNAVFRIKDHPAFYIPYVIFPAKAKRQTGFLPPAMGYSNILGAEMEVPFFWAISDQMDATFYERYMTERGFMQGLEYRYIAGDESKGTLLFDILSDKIDEKDLTDPDEAEISPFPRTNDTRYWLRSRTDQQMPLGVRAKLDTDYVSDQDYLREFERGLFGYYARPDLVKTFGRPMEDIRSPTRRSALRLDRDQEDYSLQAISSYYQRPWNPSPDPTPQPLAGMDFSLLPRALPRSPLFLRLDSDFGYIWREDGPKGERFSLIPQVGYPMWFGKYLQFEPSVRYTVSAQSFDRTNDEKRWQTNNGYNFQTRLSTVLERTFDVAWGGATKVKHKFLPSLIWRYGVNPESDLDQPWFELTDTSRKSNLLILALENFLDARKESKKGEVNYEQWSTFSLYQGYNIDEEREDDGLGQEKTPFLPLVGILTISPYPSLYFDAEAHWDWYDQNLPFADVGFRWSIERSRGRADSIGIDYRYRKETGEDGLNLSFNVNLVDGLSVGASIHRDLSSKQSVDEKFYLDYQSQCWGVRVITDSSPGINSFMVIFRLVGLGDVRTR